MKDLITNFIRFGKYFITIVVGLAAFAISPLLPLFEKPTTAIATIVALVSSFIGLTLVLRAMLGLDAL